MINLFNLNKFKILKSKVSPSEKKWEMYFVVTHGGKKSKLEYKNYKTVERRIRLLSFFDFLWEIKKYSKNIAKKLNLYKPASYLYNKLK